MNFWWRIADARGRTTVAPSASTALKEAVRDGLIRPTTIACCDGEQIVFRVPLPSPDETRALLYTHGIKRFVNYDAQFDTYDLGLSVPESVLSAYFWTKAHDAGLL